MGVVELNPHLETSSRTVASLNGIHSEARLGKKPVEVGECSYRPSLSNIKRQIVSCVRDFPPGCGRNVPHFTGASSVGVGRIDDENEVDVSDLMNTDVTALEDEIFDLREDSRQLSNNVAIVEGAGSDGTVDQAERLISRDGNDDGREVGNLIFSAGQVGGDSDLMSSSVSTVGTVASVTSQNDVSDLSKTSHLVCVATPDEEMVPVLSNRNFSSISVSNVHGWGKTPVRSYPPRRHISAVRDFPLFCGRNAALVGRGFGEGQSDMGNKPSSSIMNTMMQQAREDNVQEEEFQENKLGGNVSEVTAGGVQTECKGHVIEEMERKDHCIVYPKMNEVEDTRKNDSEPPQENNGCQGTRNNVEHSEKEMGKQIVVYHEKNRPGGISQERRMIVLSLMAASDYSLLNVRGVERSDGGSISKQKKPDGGTSRRKRKKADYMIEIKQKKPGGDASESKQKTLDFNCQPEGYKTTSREKRDSKLQKTNGSRARKTANEGPSMQLVIRNEDLLPISCYKQVCPPPSGQCGSSNGVRDDGAIVTRNKVRETLRLFQAVVRKLMQEDEAKSKEGGTSRRRFDLQAAKILKEKQKYVNVGKQILGAVPGVEVGDDFHYRVELNMIGLHRQIQGGIDYVKHGGKILATSIVASGGYADALDNSNSLVYTGQGGNVINTEKEPEDQKLERGNLALKNSLHEKNPVRVIRGSESSDGKSRTYVYDGLFLVEKCWQDIGPHNKLVFKFQLDRIGAQPELAWKELKKFKMLQSREGICVDDISGGKESIPICAMNTIDDEKPPQFEYITSVIYPDWCRPLPLRGCGCTDGCSDSEICSCAVQNGGEIPFNFNGAIVEAKPLVYECGPSCKCPPSCHNRVSQYGIQFQLEIFKTKSMGWGVRSLNSIPSGSFICEYVGELLEEKEAEARTGNDEYLFDIGNNYNDNSLWDGLSTLMPDAQSNSYEVVEEGSFTIDAAWKGNLGRFINHSCSPNLYAQNVLYDHEDNRIPHIMFFAAENIPPLQELTYHYNYTIDQVRDSNGNIKKKNCYCGSPECTGRLY